jgi:hypothetical protein
MRIEMAEHPQAIVDTMDQLEQEMQRAELIHKLGTYGTYLLIGAGAVVIAGSIFLGQVIFAFGGFILLIAGTTVRSKLARAAPPKKRFEATRQILHTLRDDTGRKGWVVGWLDLTSPRQKQKKVRTAYTTSGKRKEYYRDPWFRVRIKLADRNLLRLTLEDKIKVKMGKRGFVTHVTQFSAKLVVNLDLYHPNPISPTGSQSLANATVSAADGVLTVRAEGLKPDQLPVNSILEALKTLYSYLEPVQQQPKLRPLTPRPPNVVEPEPKLRRLSPRPPNTNVENQT